MNNDLMLVSRETLSRWRKLLLTAEFEGVPGEIQELLTAAPAALAAPVPTAREAEALAAEKALGIERLPAESVVPVQSEQEPVAVLYKSGYVMTKADCGDVFDICCKVETPLYAEPVRAVRLPERMSPNPLNYHASMFADGFNEALDEVHRLNGVEPR